MKIAINKSYGSFKLSDEFKNKYNDVFGFTDDDYFNDYIQYRNDEKFNHSLEEFGLENSCTGKIKIVEIPDESTDFDIINYDGLEYVIYVVDGLIHEVF